MSIERELMRGAGPVAVLKLLERGEMYGYEIAEALTARTDGLLTMGQSTLYPMLYNLEAKGLIEARWDEAGARPRKYYRLTADGRTRLTHDARHWETTVSAMRALGVVTRGRSGDAADTADAGGVAVPA
jgi:PadR family transcriptional regulator PadR